MFFIAREVNLPSVPSLLYSLQATIDGKKLALYSAKKIFPKVFSIFGPLVCPGIASPTGYGLSIVQIWTTGPVDFFLREESIQVRFFLKRNAFCSF